MSGRFVKNIARIGRSQCLNVQLQYAHDPKSYREILNNHPWCQRYCKESCMMNDVQYCATEAPEFCEKYCKQSCFHTGGPPPSSLSMQLKYTTPVMVGYPADNETLYDDRLIRDSMSHH